MQAYFSASIVGRKYHLEKYQVIIDTLTKLGVSVTADHILKTTEEEIRLLSKEERLNFHRKLEGWINNCDCMVVEASFPSISVGYEISLALNRNKPVLILYSEGDAPALFAYHHDERIICTKYTSQKNLETTIGEFLRFVRGNEDIRFTFFITPAISAYLDQVAKTAKMPKSVYLRKLIEADMHKTQQSPGM